MIQPWLIGSRNSLSRKIISFQESVRLPFYNNALSLIALQVMTAVFGYLFWLVVTRTASPEQIGLGAALFSGAIFIVGLAVLGFDDGLIYYLPRSAQPGELINATYSVTALITMVLAVGFIAGIKLWAPDLIGVQASPLPVVLFIACAIVLQVGTMQDAVFVAERNSRFALVKGIIANLLKFPVWLLFLAAGAWTILLAAAASVLGSVVICGWVYRRQQSVSRFAFRLAPRIWSPMIRFSFGNYVTNLVVSLPNTLLPLIILSRLGAEANAYFYVGWMLGNIVNVIGRSFGTSLFVESGRDMASIRINVKRSLRISAIVLIPSILLLVVGSRSILGLFGKHYSAEAYELVNLIAISCIPLTLHGVAVGVLKSKNKVAELIIVGVVFAALHIGLSVWLADTFGLPGIGYAVIISRTVAACLAVVFAFGAMRSPNLRSKVVVEG
jgi:O-antigen/teichoic acid export membrane protein